MMLRPVPRHDPPQAQGRAVPAKPRNRSDYYQGLRRGRPVCLDAPIGHVLVTGPGPRYAPLLDMDADQVRDLLSGHVVLGRSAVRLVSRDRA